MFRIKTILNATPFRGHFNKINRNFANTASIRARDAAGSSHIILKEEVRSALATGQPIVALESTIITHGMPYPQNIQCALDVENNVRLQGAIPATIAILEGRIKVGLEPKEIEYLGDTKRNKSTKTSRRDFAYVLSNKINGGTTVSGTMIVAAKAGIPIFATGGIGGVHRLGEETFDISADLTELGRTRVAVVSSGIKSILDIPKTLEYLETQGVFVATYGETKSFPAFYSRESGCMAPYNLTGPSEAASVIHAAIQLGLESGQVIAVPVPAEQAMDSKFLDEIIEEALEKSRRLAVSGKETTPFLLAEVAAATKGKSLQTNIALVKNNATVAAQIAVELSKLEKTDQQNRNPETTLVNETDRKRPFIIGGSNLDRCASLEEKEIKLDGRIHMGKFTENPGGVSRNICDALGKLQMPPFYLTVVGGDAAGQSITSSLHPKSRDLIQISDKNGTGQCLVVFDKSGECQFLIGDMEVHGEITPRLILSKEDLIRRSPLLVLDGNLSIEALDTSLQLAQKYNIPVLYEPTDVPISIKPFKSQHWKAIKYITPNLAELQHIAHFFNIHTSEKQTTEIQTPQQETKQEKYKSKVEIGSLIGKRVAEHVENVIVTLGSDGLLIIRRGQAEDPLLKKETCSEGIQIRHYPVPTLSQVVNVSGAGDCLAAGIIASMLEGLSEEKCVAVGFAAAKNALRSRLAVPEKLFDKCHPIWKESASYKNIDVLT